MTIDTESKCEYSVVEITYHSSNSASSCIERFGQIATRFPDQEWIIIDNSCDKEEAARLTQLTGRNVDIYSSPRNLGFAGGVNAALRIARGRWIILINPDVTLNTNGVDFLFEEISRTVPKPFAFAGGLVDDNGRRWAGIRFRWGIWFEDRLAGSQSTLIGPSGGFAVFDRSTLLSLDGFDESYFAWGEDAELALRAAKAGLVTKELSVFFPHSGGHSIASTTMARQRAYSLSKNRVRVARNYYPLQLKARFVVVWILLLLPRTLRNIHRKATYADLAGFLDGWRSQPVFGRRFQWKSDR